MSARPLIDELLARLPDARRGGGADGSGVLPEALRDRVQRDPAVGLLWQRLVAQVRTLDALPRLAAPSDLEGRVVAAIHEGYLQQRAADQFASVERFEAPPALDARVRHLAERPFALPGVGAPSVLDRLVELEVEDSRGLVARLIDRIAADDRSRSPLRRILARRTAAARPLRRIAGAAVIVAAGLFGWSRFAAVQPSDPVFATELLATGTRPGDSGKIRFEVLRPGEEPPAELASLLDAVTGGTFGGPR